MKQGLRIDEVILWNFLVVALLIWSHTAYAAPRPDPIPTPNPVRASQLVSASKTNVTQVWNIPENALFFKSNPNADWHKIPVEEHEWIQVGPLSKNLFIALDPWDAGRIVRRGEYVTIDTPEIKAQPQKQVWEEWRQAIRSQWLPTPEMITVATLTKRNGSVEQVAHCAFAHQSYRGLYISTLGQDFWLYIEQPDPLPKGVKPLQAIDVLRPDIYRAIANGTEETFYPSVAVQSRNFIRYRAFMPTGTYQRVRILLIHGRFPTQLDFRSFGYP
jgi:hypothetical protein